MTIQQRSWHSLDQCTLTSLLYYILIQGAANEGSGAFKGFAGFGAITKTTTPSFTFNSFSSSSSVSASTTQSNGATTASSSAVKPIDSNLLAKGKLSNGTSKSPSNKTKYMTQLKTLNEGVVKWIKQHVDSNPYCILTPIFTDYEKYLKEIEQKYPYKEDEKTSADETEVQAGFSGEDLKKEEEKKEDKEEKGEQKPPLMLGSSGTGIFGSTRKFKTLT